MNDHFDTALGKHSLGLLKPFQHKNVMAQIGFRVIVQQAENNQNRQIIPIGLLNCIFKRVIVFSPLGLLHPVEHIRALTQIPAV